jgi:phage shock protein A
MCTGGINVTQFKLSTYQMLRAGELYQKNIKQWADLAYNVGSEVLAQKLAEASEKVSTVTASLESVMTELDRLSSEGESVTITPME